MCIPETTPETTKEPEAPLVAIVCVIAFADYSVFGISGLQFLILTLPSNKLPLEYSLNMQVLVLGS